MNKRIFIVLLLVAGINAKQGTNNDDVKECVETGIANNFDVLQRQLQARK